MVLSRCTMMDAWLMCLALFLLFGWASGMDHPENETPEYQEWHTGLLTLLYLLRRRRGRARSRRRFWVCPTNSRRQNQGAWDNFVRELRAEEPEKFHNYHRMSRDQFDDLLIQISPRIQRTDAVREPIPAGLKLSLTLRYLAAGESMVSLAYNYRIGKSTTSAVIRETCIAIWEALQPQVLVPPTRDHWETIAADFHRMWNFPNCVGAIDGKHVVVQCFNKTGSDFYNYKGTFSTTLMAVADAQYRFVFVSIGSKGRESDGGIFQSCNFGKAIAQERLPLPEPIHVADFPFPLPPVFLGDQAFPLLPQLMRPFPTSAALTPHQRIFNYRHCRARRVVENAFGILSSRFRIFRKPIVASVDTVDAIVQAAVVLHNWLRNQDISTGENSYIPNTLHDQEDEDGTFREGSWRHEPAPTGLVPGPSTASRNPSVRAKAMRERISTFFMTVGQVPWQWRHLPVMQTQ